MSLLERVGRHPLRGARTARPLLAFGVLAVALAASVVPGTSGAFSAQVTNSADKAVVNTSFDCEATFNSTLNKGDAYLEYRVALSGSSSTNDVSSAGNGGSYNGAHNTDTARPIACPNNASSAPQPTAYAPDGSSSYISTSVQSTNPTTFSLAIWFKSSTAGGYLIGFADNQTGAATTNFDRHLYLNTSGSLVFGCSYSGGMYTLVSPKNYADGVWHQAVATKSPSGMALWVDGTKVKADTSYTGSVSYAGYWRIGYGTLTGWPGTASNTYFAGSVRYFGVYKHVLSDGEIAGEYRNGAPA